jgi:hypothetical protein
LGNSGQNHILEGFFKKGSMPIQLLFGAFLIKGSRKNFSLVRGPGLWIAPTKLE